MSTQIKFRGGTTVQHSTFIGAERELTVDTTKDTLIVHDGGVLGGYPLARVNSIYDFTCGNLTSTGIDDNATSVALVIDSTQDVTFTSDIKFPDNGKALFGAGLDLEIYHNGTDSYISDTGIGDLNILGSNYIRLQSASGEDYIQCNKNGAVQLMYDNAEKIRTSITGALVSGTLDVTSLASLDGGIDVDGAFTVANTTGNIATTGTLDVTGAGTIGGNLDVTGNTHIVGDLRVDGVTTTINSTTVTIDDAIFVLGGDTAPTIDDNKDRGIQFQWHDGSDAKVGFFGYDDSASEFVFVSDAANTLEVISGSLSSVAFGSARVEDLTSGRILLGGVSGEIEDHSNLTFNGSALNVTGTLDVTGAGTIGGNLDVTGNTHIVGDLRVDGTTTTINSVVVTIDDGIFVLGGDTAPTFDDNKDRGIQFQYHDGISAKIGFFGYDESASEFVVLDNATNSAEVISGSLSSVAFGSVRVEDLTNDRVLFVGNAGEIEDHSNLTFDGNTLAVTGTVSADIVELKDNDEIRLGNSADFKIYHDGSDSYISDVGTGDLNILASNDLHLRAASGEHYIQCVENAEVNIFYNNLSKLTTTSTGVDITGAMNATTVTGDGSGLTNLATYAVKASSQTGGAGIDLDTSTGGTDTVTLKGLEGTTVTQLDANTINITTPDNSIAMAIALG